MNTMLFGKEGGLGVEVTGKSHGGKLISIHNDAWFVDVIVANLQPLCKQS